VCVLLLLLLLCSLQLLVKNPQDRFKFSDIPTHPFIVKNLVSTSRGPAAQQQQYLQQQRQQQQMQQQGQGYGVNAGPPPPAAGHY